MRYVLMVGTVASNMSGVLFIVVVGVQARMYGFRTWVEYGLGTGRPVHDHKVGAQAIVKACGECEKACPLRE